MTTFFKNINVCIGIFVLFMLANSMPLLAANEPEEACFKLLAEAANNDSRFQYRGRALDFGSLQKEETDRSNRVDLSTYQKFQENRDCRLVNGLIAGTNGVGSKGAFTNECKAEYAKNPSNVKYIFPAQRTHIATLLKADDYAVTQYSSFGTDTNFSYPYKILDSADKNSTGIRTGFAYDGAFKNFMVYTHHLADPSHDFPFLSCGIIRIIPKSNDSNKFQMVGNYMANTFGSRYMASEVSKDGKTFRKLSATVPTIDIDGQEMADMEVLAFGFDNGSDSLSDYWTFHYAAEVMKDPSLSVQNGALIDNKKSGTDGSIITYFKKFRQMLEDKTCFTLVHTGNTIIGLDEKGFITENKGMPNNCPASGGSLRASNPIPNRFAAFASNILSKISFPYAQALSAADFNPGEVAEMQKKFDNAVNSPTYGTSYGVGLDVYKRLDLFEDRNLVKYIELGLSSELETMIRSRAAKGVALSDYEKKFIDCPVSYMERVESLSEFVRSIKDPKNIDIRNIKYKNPIVGDCIVPFPDVTRQGKVQPYAFETNKLVAQAISQTGAFSIPPAIQALIKKEESLNIEYMRALETLEKQRFITTGSGGITSDEYIEKEKSTREEYLPKLQKLNEEITQAQNNFIQQTTEKQLEAIDGPSSGWTRKQLGYSLGGGFILLALATMYITLRIRRKS